MATTKTGKYLPYSSLSKHFGMPIVQASRELGICTTFLKQICRSYGVKRWPFRKIKSLQSTLATMKESKMRATQRSHIERAERTISEIEAELARFMTPPADASLPPGSSPIHALQAGRPGMSRAPTGLGLGGGGGGGGSGRHSDLSPHTNPTSLPVDPSPAHVHTVSEANSVVSCAQALLRASGSCGSLGALMAPRGGAGFLGVVAMLSGNDLAALACASSAFHEAMSNDFLWRYLCEAHHFRAARYGWRGSFRSLFRAITRGSKREPLVGAKVVLHPLITDKSGAEEGSSDSVPDLATVTRMIQKCGAVVSNDYQEASHALTLSGEPQVRTLTELWGREAGARAIPSVPYLALPLETLRSINNGGNYIQCPEEFSPAREVARYVKQITGAETANIGGAAKRRRTHTGTVAPAAFEVVHPSGRRRRRRAADSIGVLAPPTLDTSAPKAPPPREWVAPGVIDGFSPGSGLTPSGHTPGILGSPSNSLFMFSPMHHASASPQAFPGGLTPMMYLNPYHASAYAPFGFNGMTLPGLTPTGGVGSLTSGLTPTGMNIGSIPTGYTPTNMEMPAWSGPMGPYDPAAYRGPPFSHPPPPGPVSGPISTAGAAMTSAPAAPAPAPAHR